jgi:hypothetical protein
MQLMVRKKGGNRKMKTDRRRIDIVPLWRKEPDVRLFAEAVVAMARERRAADQQPKKGAKPPKEEPRG